MHDWVATCGGHLLGLVTWVIWTLNCIGLFLSLASWTLGCYPSWAFGLLAPGCRIWTLRTQSSGACYEPAVLRCVRCVVWLVFCCWVASKKRLQWFGSTMQEPGQRVGWTFGRVGLSWPSAFWIPGHCLPAVFVFSGVGDQMLSWWFQRSGARSIHERLKYVQHAMWIVFLSWIVSTQCLRWCAQLSLRAIPGVLWILGRAGLFWPLALWTPGHSPFWVFGLFGLCCRLLSLREPFRSAWYNHEVLKCVQCALWIVFTWWTVSKRCLMVVCPEATAGQSRRLDFGLFHQEAGTWGFRVCIDLYSFPKVVPFVCTLQFVARWRSPASGSGRCHFMDSWNCQSIRA